MFLNGNNNNVKMQDVLNFCIEPKCRDDNLIGIRPQNDHLSPT